MRRLKAGVSWPLPGRLTGQVRLLLMLSAALLGFFWLLDYLVSLVSTAPADILASSPSPEEFKSVPTGVALLQFSTFAVSAVLAAAVLVATLGWPLSRSSFRLSPSIVLGTVSSAAIVAAGAYLALSGVLERRVSYDRHLVEGSLLETGALVVLAVVFFSIAIAGVVNRKTLVAVLAAWLVLGLAFGFLNPSSLDGLDLFERSISPQESAAFVSVVEKYRRSVEAPGDETSPGTSSKSDTADGSTSRDATSLSTGKGLPSPGDTGDRWPVFQVAGAAHTRYLRVATGDVYGNGEWRQLDSQTVPVGPDVSVEDAVTAMIQRLGAQDPALASTGRLSPALLGSPVVTPFSIETDEIRVFPLEEAGAIAAGAVPISQYPTGIETAGMYDPFSATLTLPEPVTQYGWSSSVPKFALADLVSAEVSTDEAYLQLPSDLPERILEVAEQFRVSRSAYLNANRIMLFMGDELTYLPGDVELERPPDGSDPVDWLLFESRNGDDVSYSSAFVVLARSAGIPARVVSGWVIEELEGEQVVYAQQFHHWAEIALDGVGWTTFDPASWASRLQDADKINVELALELLTESADPAVRVEAVEALGEAGGEDALPWLVEAMESDSEEDVRQASMIAIQKLDFDSLVWLLLNHEDPEIRTAAAKALSAMQDARAVQPFMQALSGDEFADVRLEIAEGLAYIGKDRAEGGLLQAATADADASVREAAVRSLGTLRTGWTARQLISILGTDSESRVREAAALSLGQIREAEALPPLIRARSEDEVESVRQAARGALAWWSSPRLVSILQESEMPVERAAAAQLLGEREYTDAIPALISALHDPSEIVRIAALAALESMGEITWLENGSAFISQGGELTFSPGATTRQASRIPHIPVFSVSGAANTNYLRTGVGDVYRGGGWMQLDPVAITYTAPGSVSETVWNEYSDETGLFASIPEERRMTESLFGFVEGSDNTNEDRIRISPAGEYTELTAGLAPTSLYLQSVDQSGRVYPYSATFSTNEALESFSWTAEIPTYTAAQYAAAVAAPDPTYVQLPENLPERIRELALSITSGHDTTYAKAEALKEHLSSSYTYRFADDSRPGAPPPGQDPVDWFLFDSGEGTCGQFSSAFVVLARSVGIPARVASGWAVSAMDGTQTVFLDQAHQWAEVAFEGLGWVTFEPTASGGAPYRAEVASDDGAETAQDDPWAALDSNDPAEREAALDQLEEQGASVIRLETGAALVSQDRRVSFSPGTSTGQAAELLYIPVFNVIGAANTSYLRTSVGDVYRGGKWRRLDPVIVPYTSGDSVPDAVQEYYSSPFGQFASLPDYRRETESLFGFLEGPDSTYENQIRIYPAGNFAELPAGLVPTSLYLQSLDQTGEYYPFSSTFSTNVSMDTYSWTAAVPAYTETQYAAAVASSDSTYTQLPEDLPKRIRELALSITAGHDTTHAKARALETYLSTEYTYMLADGTGQVGPQPGQDPVDWFLFDSGEGTCGQFSSAFAVLARSIGIPARVTSGWFISATADAQTVYALQAHQWAEVPFEGLGWVTFEPTAAGAAPYRVAEASELTGRRWSNEPEPPPPPKETFTTITQWPAEVRRQKPFIVGGEVTTADGENVAGLQVDIFVNETKEHGGVWVGTATTTGNGYQAEVTLPANVELGDYQLLARAVGNDNYYESWSDPDITVYSGSGLELTGPSEVTVDAEATFRGRLSEDTGKALVGRQLIVTVDGAVAPSVMTDSSGQFAFSRTFSTAGPHWVEVEVEDTEFVLDSTARLNFQVTLPTETVLHAPAIVDVGEEFVVTGELHDIHGTPLGGEEVYVQVGDGPEQTVFTDRSGSFEFTETVFEAGEFTVRAEFRRNGPVLSSNGTARLSSQHGVVLTIDGPGLIEQGEGATFVGRLESDSAAPTGDLMLTIENSLGSDSFAVTTDGNGGFEYHHSSFEHTGTHTLTGSFAGGGSLGSSTAGISFRVAAPTLLTVRGPKGVRDGETVELTGSLLQRNGRAVPDAEIRVAGQEPLTLVTDEEGRFAWEVVAELDRTASEEQGEPQLFIEADFAGTDHLGPSSASLEIAVGLPRIVTEALEPVARGATASLRGTVLVGNIPLAGVPVSIGEDDSLRSNEVGAFTYDYHVSTDLPLGAGEIVVSVEEIGASVTVPILVMSASSMTFEQAEESVPGEETLLSATLLDDKGVGIPRATLRSSQGVEALTDDSGVALFEVTVPETEELALVPLTFTYDGDSRYMPHTETFVLAIQPPPAGINWLLWVGLPVLLAATVAATLARRRLMAFPASVAGSLRAKATPVADPIAAAGDDSSVEGEDVESRQQAGLEIVLVKAAADLPDVWGVGEDVTATVSLTDWQGLAIAGASVMVSMSGANESVQLVTDEHGNCNVSWAGHAPGEHPIEAKFEGDESHLPASNSRAFRVVDFREEIVVLYNSFLEWAGGMNLGITEQFTPREVELCLVSEGVPVDQKSLDELISRFEEADYSEHPIARRHYESMYRAWRTVVGA